MVKFGKLWSFAAHGRLYLDFNFMKTLSFRMVFSSCFPPGSPTNCKIQPPSRKGKKAEPQFSHYKFFPFYCTGRVVLAGIIWALFSNAETSTIDATFMNY